MWLKYAVNQDGALVEIEEVASGKTLLKCPYCDGALTAKKGRIKEHHFAHTGETCRAVSDGHVLGDSLQLKMSAISVVLLKIRGSLRAAKTWGSRSPATIALIIAMDVTPVRSLITLCRCKLI